MASKAEKNTSEQEKPVRRTRKNMSRGEILERQDNRIRKIGSIILFAVGVLLVALTLREGESLWKLLHTALFAVFSWGAYFLGPIFIVYSILGMSNRASIILSNKVWQTLILVVVICITIEVFDPMTELQFASEETVEALQVTDPESYTAAREIKDRDAIEQVIALATDGIEKQGGGLCSALIAWPLLALLGTEGTRITMIVALLVVIMLVTGFTVLDLIRAFTKPIRTLEKKYQENKEARSQEPETVQTLSVPTSARTRKQNVDVPVYGDEQELPQHPVRSADSSPVRKARPAFDVDIGPEPKQDSAALRNPKARGTVKPAVKAPAAPESASGTAASAPATTEQLLAPKTVPAEKIPEVAKPAEKPAEKAGPAEPTAEDKAVEGLITSAASSQNRTDPSAQTVEEKVAESGYVIPSTALLDRPTPVDESEISDELRGNATLLVDTLASFGVQTKIVDISRGPSVTRYELQPSAGVKISRITGLSDDIAMNLAAAGVRIEAPIPNKAAVGIEVPNKIVSTVQLSEIIESAEFRKASSHLTVALGRNIEGRVMITDIAKMPHLLIAGSTGSGKSVCINSFIISLLYKSTPQDVRLLLIDPKVVELGIYNGIPHLLIPVVTDPRKAAGALAWAVNEMLNRYALFAENSVRDLRGYNQLAEENPDLGLSRMPQIVIIIDELADLMMAAPNDVEASVCRLAQMARAAGMHLIIATQRPSVDVITGVIKANIPSRIAFAVASQVDSRTILDGSGAEKLLGRGDMLFNPMGISKPQRIQGCFVSDHEVERVVTMIKNQGEVDYDQQVIDDIERQAVPDKDAPNPADEGVTENDELLRDAVEIVIDAGQASTSLLQRKLKVGYARAGRLIDEMERRGIIGPFEGSKPRQVLISAQQFMEMDLNGSQE